MAAPRVYLSMQRSVKAVEESQNDLERYPEVRYIDLEYDWVKPDFIGRKCDAIPNVV